MDVSEQGPGGLGPQPGWVAPGTEGAPGSWPSSTPPAAPIDPSMAPGSGYGNPGYGNPGYGAPQGGNPGYGNPGNGNPGNAQYGNPLYRNPGPQWGNPGYGAGVPMKYCFSCGRTLDARAEICPSCGARQPWSAAVGARPRRDRIVAALLAIFLGNFGIHKFYLGQIGRGILYLIFSWTGIPGVIGFVEGIIFLTKSDAQWAAEFGDGVPVDSGRTATGCLVAVAIALILLGLLIFLRVVTDTGSLAGTY
jgi:TM2 domain-containing membrane protein YozV